MSGNDLLLAFASPDAVPGQPSSDAWWADLVRLTIESGGVSVHLGLIVLGAVAVVVCVWGFFVVRRMRRHAPKWDTAAVTLKLGDLVEMEIRPNHETARIAFQAWVEIRTRKVGLPFDEDHDVIVEVYDSWYTLFEVLRDLTKSIPAYHIRDCSDTCKLVEAMFKVLNGGLRPHLTRWQARFRQWYEAEQKVAGNEKKSPQEIQRGFPQYVELVADLKKVNADFVEFAASLGRLAGCER
jgi:hypothetical protein